MDTTMPIDEELFKIDYLVYSSHKTATQTLVATLNSNGFKCKHCHFLATIGIESGGFQEYLEKYVKKNGKKLNIITVFRDPIERYISSFFQGYGTRPIRLKEVDNEFDTVIYKYSIKQLQDKFISELKDQSLNGIDESIYGISRELQMGIEILNYIEEERSGLYETESFILHIYRFDILTRNMEELLSKLTGKKIEKKNANISSSKWYRDIYFEFKASLVIPGNDIREVYNSKRDLINLLYTEDFDVILNRAMAKYG